MQPTFPDADPFYVGYLPRAPQSTARFTRRVVAAIVALSVAAAAMMAVTLPYFGAGVFHYGRPETAEGTLQCETAARLVAENTEYLLVGYGKNGVGPELCGPSAGKVVQLRGTRIARDGRHLLEVTSLPEVRPDERARPAANTAPLVRVSLTGEIVDPKCYFGVMNPGESRVHRACAVLCLRGGIPAVFVARDRSGARVPLLITDHDGRSVNEALLPWVGEPVQASGEVFRQGKWLVWRIDPATLAWAR